MCVLATKYTFHFFGFKLINFVDFIFSLLPILSYKLSEYQCSVKGERGWKSSGLENDGSREGDLVLYVLVGNNLGVSSIWQRRRWNLGVHFGSKWMIVLRKYSSWTRMWWSSKARCSKCGIVTIGWCHIDQYHGNKIDWPFSVDYICLDPIFATDVLLDATNDINKS